MNYKLLQVGDETTDGDEVWSPDAPKWRKAWPGDKVAADDINYGRFYRRSEGVIERTVCVETHTTATRVMTVTRLDAELYLTGGLDTGFRVPLSCVGNVVKAIREVAGI